MEKGGAGAGGEVAGGEAGAEAGAEAETGVEAEAAFGDGEAKEAEVGGGGVPENSRSPSIGMIGWNI